jgi:pyridoxine kinase
MTMHKILTLAGSDTSGGAGIQADLKTFQERGVYGMTALTTIVAMDPDNNWAHQVFPIDLNTVKTQLKTILEGVGVDAMKTGMLGSVELIELAADTIDRYDIPYAVIDPVMVCKGTDEVLHPETAVALREVLVPKATVVTPNLFEAYQLSGHGPLSTIDDMKEAAARIYDAGAQHVVIKGGKDIQDDKAVDVLYDGKSFELLENVLIDTSYTHGSGCTFAACVTAELAKGQTVRDAVHLAKAFTTEAIRSSFPLNQYVGPTRHAAYRLAQESSPQAHS